MRTRSVLIFIGLLWSSAVYADDPLFPADPVHGVVGGLFFDGDKGTFGGGGNESLLGQVDFMDTDGALYVPGAEELTRNLARLTRSADCLAPSRVVSGKRIMNSSPPYRARTSTSRRQLPMTSARWRSARSPQT